MITVMSFAKVVTLLRGFGRNEAVDGQFLLSQQQFHLALKIERVRSDRSGIGFCVLNVAVERIRSCTPKVVAILERRLRNSDMAGWFDSHSVGIILPFTSEVGAWKLSDELRQLLHEQNLDATFAVHVYGPFEPPGHEGDAEQRADGNSLSPRTSQPLKSLFVEKLPVSKRLTDLVFASCGLVLTSPILLLTAIAIKITSPGPILYRQLRDGLGGQRFWIYKLRTMVVNADTLKVELRAINEQDGPAFKIRNDPRVTPLGRVLRRTCIDELPQLWNVLKGEMTLVGPRPMCSKESQECTQWQQKRLDVTPGLTCLWQIQKTRVAFIDWMRLDLRYVKTRSFWSDLLLIVRTIPSIIRRDGVY